MRILFVGGIQLKNDASRYFDVARKIVNGLTRNGHNVLFFADRDVSRFSNIFKSRKMGVKKCNKELIKRIPVFQPDMIVFQHADVIKPYALEEIRSKWPHIRMAQVNVDPIFNPDNVERINEKSGLVDANFITTYGDSLEKIKKNGKSVYYIPNPVDSSIEEFKAFENKVYESDLFFAYGYAPQGDPRFDIPKSILEKSPEINFRLCVSNEGTSLWGHKYVATLAKSKCGLNLSRKQEKDRFAQGDDLYMYSSDRISHYMGNGLLTFTDAEFSLDNLFSEDEMVFYETEADLHDKLKFYLNEKNDAERIRVAKKGWEKAHNSYNERLVASFIVDKAFGLAHSVEYDWPTESI
ncbi:MAG: glycosyltransferase family 1 protein [Alphaproteobacteria bacterium]|nr:glycosyltransferase family 1 protein [Alphaproteobacteria bacterium]